MPWQQNGQSQLLKGKTKFGAGYSGTPLVKKLGYKEGFRFYVTTEPDGFWKALEKLQKSTKRLKRLSKPLDLIHVLSAERCFLAGKLLN